jgi:hypothetical protein
MANSQGAVIQGSFIAGRPQVVGMGSPAIQMAAAQPSPQSRPVNSKLGQHAVHLQRMVQPYVAQHQDPGSQAMQPHRAGRQASVVQRVGDGEAFQLPSNLSIFGGAGQPLPDPVRGKMESFFNTSFADVRVHVGPQASSVGAIALAQGPNLYFAPGQYNPGTTLGQQLLGHELAHVVQQRAGRVRNPFGAGVAVVQDRSLEAEAERLGTAAALHQHPMQAKMANAYTDRVQTGAAFNHGSRTATIQRTIHRFKDGKWSIAELGTSGTYKKPVVEKLDKPFYFNDVNNKRGKSIKSVRAGLSDLMMMSGSLMDKNMDLPWPPELWKDLTAIPYEVGHIVILGTVTLALGQPARFKSDNHAILLQAVWNNFLSTFMERNQQLPYIRRQSWFTQGEAEVDIDINFYPDRGYGAELSFHKDTAGDNLFVNLLFNNAMPTPATEWIEDLATPLRTKRAAMKKLMPEGMRSEIRAARKAMRSQTHRPSNVGTIRGGIAPAAAYVSWVDELVWHATPSVNSRSKVSGNMANLLLYPGYYWSDDYKLNIHRALRFLSKFPDTLIGQMDLARKHKRRNEPQAAAIGWGFDTAFVDSYIESVTPKRGWNPAYYDAYNILQEGSYSQSCQGPEYKRHFDDVEKHKVQLQAAPISLAIGQELAPDPYGIGTAEMNQRTRIHARTHRSNSVGDLKGLTQAYQNNLKRSFIRTWVRVRQTPNAH